VASSHFQGAKVCAVNEATGLVKADHIATCHAEKLERFIGLHTATWGMTGDRHAPPTIHIRDMDVQKTDRPHYAWRHNFGGGSAIFAAAALIAIGFETVIFCGCPMDGGGGYALRTHEATPDDQRVGYLNADSTMIQAWHLSMEALASGAPAIASRIRSMSGRTSEIFGGIS
jgi:hypothetical protein